MKRLLNGILFLVISAGIFAQGTGEENPAAPGFNLAESDPKAIEIADAVMQAMGGRKNWDDTRYLTWRFFGRRLLIWDKLSGNVRIEADSTIYLVNVLNNGAGKIKKGKEVLVQTDSIQKYTERGISIWINDSYWLVMPFKLKDSGVTLQYRGEQATTDGKAANVLQLTFQNVGRTPDNKYYVYVDKATNLITQWDYFQKYTDEKPTLSNAWSNYQKYGAIWLSDGRGQRGHTDVGVYTFIPESVFYSFDPVDFAQFKK